MKKALAFIAVVSALVFSGIAVAGGHEGSDFGVKSLSSNYIYWVCVTSPGNSATCTVDAYQYANGYYANIYHAVGTQGNIYPIQNGNTVTVYASRGGYRRQCNIAPSGGFCGFTFPN